MVPSWKLIVPAVSILVAALLTGVLCALLVDTQGSDELSGAALAGVSNPSSDLTDPENPVERISFPALELQFPVRSHFLDMSNQVGLTLKSVTTRTTDAGRTRILASFMNEETNVQSISMWGRADDGDFTTWNTLFFNQVVPTGALVDLSSSTLTIAYVLPDVGEESISTYDYTEADGDTPGDVSDAPTFVPLPFANTSNVTVMRYDSSEDNHLYVLSDGELNYHNGTAWDSVTIDCSSFHQSGDWLTTRESTGIHVYTRTAGVWTLQEGRTIDVDGESYRGSWIASDGIHILVSEGDGSTYVSKSVYRWEGGAWVSVHLRPSRGTLDNISDVGAHIFSNAEGVFWATSVQATFTRFGNPKDRLIDSTTPYVLVGDNYGVGGSLEIYEGKRYYVMVMFSLGTKVSTESGLIGARIGTYYLPLARQ